MLWLEYPISLNLTSKQQKMKTELTASTRTEKTRVLIIIDPRTVMIISMVITSAERPQLSSQRQLIIEVAPVMMTIPQKTRRPVMISETDIKARNLERMPMVVLAELIQFSPVTDITITQLWLSIFSKFSRFLRHMEMRHRQTATAIFLFYLLFESTNILAKVMTATRIDPKTMDPKAEVKSHLQAVTRQCLPSTRQYQKAHETATVKTMIQQKRKLKKSQIKSHTVARTPSRVLSSLFLLLSSETAKIQPREQIQKKEKRMLATIFITGEMKTPHFSLRNWDAILIKMIPISILFRKQKRTIAYTMNIMRKGRANPRLPMAKPKITNPNSSTIEKAIKKQIMALGMSLIKNTQRKLSTNEMSKQVAISPAYCETQKLSTLILPFSLIQQAPPAMKAPRITKKTTTHPTSLHPLLETGSDFHSAHLELYSCWQDQQDRRLSFYG